MERKTIFWIFTIFVSHTQHTYSYGISYTENAFITTTPYPEMRTNWQDSAIIVDYRGNPAQNEPVNWNPSPQTNSGNENGQRIPVSDNPNPGQRYTSFSEDAPLQQRLNTNTVKYVNQAEPEGGQLNYYPDNTQRRDFQKQESFPQVNHNLEHVHLHYHHLHHPHHHHHPHNHGNFAHDTLHQTDPNFLQPFYNHEQFQQSNSNQDFVEPETTRQGQPGQSGLVFKVQRNPDGKLDVVVNNTANSRNGDIRQHNNHRRSTTTKSRPTPSQRQGDIIFPDDSRPEPLCIKNETDYFCTEVPNYPKDKIQAALRANFDKFKPFLGDDVVVPPNITQRIGAPGEESLCIGEEKVIFPKAGHTKDNKLSFIVNQENFTQGVRVELCRNAGKPCAMAENFPNGVEAKCQQSYIYRNLLASSETGDITRELFKYPSCCKCIIKRVGFTSF